MVAFQAREPTPGRQTPGPNLADKMNATGVAQQLYAGAVEGVSEMAREAQQEIGATSLAQSHAEGSTPRR